MTLTTPLSTLLRAHWFFFIAPLVVLADVALGLMSRGQIDRWLEVGLLVDLAVLVPALYAVCYRAQGRKALLKALGLACLGLWLALKLVPENEQTLLAHVGPLRYVGLVVLFAFEAVLLLAVYRKVFKGGSTDDAVKAVAADMPPWAARLMALEAGLWLKAWGALRRLFGRPR